MGEEERTAIAETIVEIDRKMAQQSSGEQDRLMRRRLALIEVLRSDAARQRAGLDARVEP
jgi:hypothetical protein